MGRAYLPCPSSLYEAPPRRLCLPSFLQVLPGSGGFGGTALPAGCDGMASNLAGENEPCRSAGWVLLSDYSPFIDQQPFKLQESPEVSPWEPWLSCGSSHVVAVVIVVVMVVGQL